MRIERVKMAPKKTKISLFFSRYYYHKSSYLFQGSSDVHCIGEDDPGVFGESDAVQTGGEILFLILLHPTNQAFSTKHTRLENGCVNNVAQ